MDRRQGRGRLNASIKLDRWVPMAEAAKLADEPLWRFRRRMKILNERHGGQLLKHFGRGNKHKRLHVSAEALMHHLRTDPNAIDEQVEALQAELAVTNRKLEALRDSHHAFRRKSSEWFRRYESVTPTNTNERTPASSK